MTELLDEWGALRRTGVGPAQLLHGYPTRNPLDRMRQQVLAGPPPDEDDPVELTPPEAFVQRVGGRQGRLLRVHELILGLPLLPAMCLAMHYRDQLTGEAIAEALDLDRGHVLRKREKAEAAITRALENDRAERKRLPRKNV